MATIQELSPDSGRVETRPPEDEIEGDDEDEEVRIASTIWLELNILENVKKQTKA